MNKLSPPFELIKKAVDIFAKKENLLFLVKIYIPVAIFSIISVAQPLLPESIRNSNSVWLFITVIFLQFLSLLCGVFVTISGIIAMRKIIEGSEFSVRKTYKSAWKDYWVFLLLSIILTVIYTLGFVLLLVPGFLLIAWFAFSRFLMVEKALGIRESLIKSKSLVKGMYWKILGRLLVFAVFAVVIQMVLSVIPYGAGSIVAGLCGGLLALPSYLLYKELSA